MCPHCVSHIVSFWLYQKETIAVTVVTTVTTCVTFCTISKENDNTTATSHTAHKYTGSRPSAAFAKPIIYNSTFLPQIFVISSFFILKKFLTIILVSSNRTQPLYLKGRGVARNLFRRGIKQGSVTSGTVGPRAFSVAGPAALNCLCDELREPLLTVNSFRQLLKTRLFAEY